MINIATILSASLVSVGLLLTVSATTAAGPETTGAEETGEKESGVVRGTLQLNIKGMTLSKLGKVVVYLDSTAVGEKLKRPKSKDPLKIKQVKHLEIGQILANFTPNFLVISVGQTIDFPNNDKIMHNVFSYSKGNKFDLGLYPKGTTKSVTFKHAGLVNIYCSIHKSMNGTIYVAPTQFHTVAHRKGSFEIRGVPPGTYTLKTWNRKLPATSQKVVVKADTETEAKISMGNKK